MPTPTYKRNLLKHSGDVLMGGQQYGIDSEFVAELSREVKAPTTWGCSPR